MKKQIIGILPFLFLSYAASLTTNFTEKLPSSILEKKVVFKHIEHSLSNEVIKMDNYQNTKFKYTNQINFN